MASGPFDVRARLNLGDHLAREGRFAEAIDVYQAVASHYLEQGFALRAVAVARQVVNLAQRDQNALLPRALAALRLLIHGYRALGLEREAVETEDRLRELDRPA